MLASLILLYLLESSPLLKATSSYRNKYYLIITLLISLINNIINLETLKSIENVIII